MVDLLAAMMDATLVATLVGEMVMMLVDKLVASKDLNLAEM